MPLDTEHNPPTPKVLIIGAGVCGLYAGLSLLRSGAEVTILEKEPRIGGLAAGFKFGENYCDFGVHMLHAYDQEIYQDCANLMGKERIEVALDARIRFGKATCRYPLKFKDMITSMPPLQLFRCVTGLLLAEIRGTKHSKEIYNAEDALIAFYGAPLYEFFFEEFTHQYWNIHPRDLSAEFIRRKMPRLSAVDVLRRFIPFYGKKDTALKESALNTETLHYSKTGSETLPRSIATEITRLGGTILTEATLNDISLSAQQCEIQYDHDGQKHTFQGDHLLNTAPLHSLVHSLGKSAPEQLHQAVSQLRYKPTVVYALLVNKQQCMDGQYTYYRNRVFHRVGEPKNAGLQVKPANHTLLIIEATCEVDDYKWNGTEKYQQEITRDLALEGICEETDMIEWKLLRNPHGYPIYTNGFEDHLEQIQAWIAAQPSLTSTGRQGGFCYPGMHTAMRLGKSSATDIIQQHGKP